MLPFANLQLAFDSSRERFHPLRKCLSANDFGQEVAFLSINFESSKLTISSIDQTIIGHASLHRRRDAQALMDSGKMNGNRVLMR
ncbi:MAG TPA: hypothetical protein VNX27_08980 [Chthoniobacterales bacterium]|nr:hypothetical protein [Chthoniobacterales bacterium]